jgi:spore coat protein U-like protein
MLSSWKSRILLAAAAIVVGSTSVLAQETDTLTVQVTVQEACSIAGTTIDFGTYTAGQQAALNAQGNISYNNCAAGTLTIALDGGGDGNVARRVLAHGGGDTLHYQLYRHSARSQVWGIGEQAQQIVLLEPQSGSVPVYGSIPAGQNVPGGAYTDTVNITLTF